MMQTEILRQLNFANLLFIADFEKCLFLDALTKEGATDSSAEWLETQESLDACLLRLRIVDWTKVDSAGQQITVIQSKELRENAREKF